MSLAMKFACALVAVMVAAIHGYPGHAGAAEEAGEDGKDFFEVIISAIHYDEDGIPLANREATLDLDPLTGLLTEISGDPDQVTDIAPADTRCTTASASVRRNKSYWLVTFTYYEYVQEKSWCYDRPAKHTIGLSHVDQGFFRMIDPLWIPSGQGVRTASRFSYISGYPYSGHYSKWQERIDNCLPPPLLSGTCIKRDVPFVEIWSHSDGSWRYRAGVN